MQAIAEVFADDSFSLPAELVAFLFSFSAVLYSVILYRVLQGFCRSDLVA